jgi:trimeric autotransporter adhesin
MKNRNMILSLLGAGCLAIYPVAQAVVPPPDGGYPGENTAEGEDALFSLTTGIRNTAVGFHALYDNTDGWGNTAIGDEALSSNISVSGQRNTAAGASALTDNISGNGNTAIGYVALWMNTTGSDNTAIGEGALAQNSTGNFNTAVGDGALGGCGFLSVTGDNNAATGFSALLCDTTGSNNTANGLYALRGNTTGNNNTAVGAYALYNGDHTGDNNTAMGFQALYSNISGIDNTATGLNALFSNTDGNENTANGHSALQNNTTGNDNTAVGHDALFNNTTGSNNIALGHGAGLNLTTGSNNIDIGFFGVAGEANTIRIGTQGTQTKTFIAGINGAGITGLPIKVDANGQLGTTPSSARFKQGIKPMNKASETIFVLRPVTFHYKKDIDPEGAPQFGLVAEEVEKVDPDLVVRDETGKPYSVRYDQVNAMLLNEFIKEHRKVQQLKKDFESKFAQQQKQIEALTAGLQKVNAQVQLSKTAPKVVLNESTTNENKEYENFPVEND